MRELRSVVNALVCFLIFLLIYAFSVPGHAKGKNAPHFLRMEIVEGLKGASGSDRISFSLPFGLVRHGLRATVGGKVRRELCARFDESIEADEVRGLWKELAEKPEGTEVTRTYDETKWTFTKAQGTVAATVRRPGSDESDRATIRVPASLLEKLVGRDCALDADTLLSELTSLSAGSLLEIESSDGKVRVWVD